MDKLKDELPAYLAAAEDVSPDVETLGNSLKYQIPTWAKAFQLILLVQPSSAAAEWVLSLLQNS